MVSDGLHCVEVAVRPVDSLGDYIKSNPCWCAKSAFDQFHTIAAIHESTLKLGLLVPAPHVCEEHISTKKQKLLVSNKHLKLLFCVF